MGLIVIDGADGGGQILRSALTLSMITQQPFQITNIRGKRSNPGLGRQHLTCITAAANVCNGKAKGADLKSRELIFYPGQLQPGEHHIDIGTAGSTVLVAQTLLPVLWSAGEPSTLHITGGTHNRNAPTADYFETVYLPAIQQLGIQVTVELVRHGFEPKGGGEIRVQTSGQWKPQPTNFLERGTLESQKILVSLHGLDESIVQREIQAAVQVLGWDMSMGQIVAVKKARGAGNVVAIDVRFSKISEQTIGIGVRGVLAETVARDAATAMVQYLNSDAVVGKRLADQLQLPLALIGTGQMRMLPASNHFKTNARVIEAFTGKRFASEEQDNNTVLATVVI
ncbi:MAG: RNA 3'-terminal phosphate cyclase [Leptolyngbyaceae cyanobacterium MAG.088]|nr:RNA 3'-terminal phosphate cyclase [Leptolyngbyaceae cyanobacterium MAG.088]